MESALEKKEEKTQMQTAAQYYRSKGRKEGLKKGLEKGLEKGLARGREEVLARFRGTVTRLLGKRASKATKARIATADLDTLESMLDALVAR